jgi:hypothetical protein
VKGPQRTEDDWVRVLTDWVAAGGGERSGQEACRRTYPLSARARAAWARMVDEGVVRPEKVGRRTVWKLASPGAAPRALAALPAPGPVPEVVALCRELLERAESGDVIGVAIAAAHRGRATGSSYALGEGTVDQLVCGALRLQTRLLAIGGEDVP